MQRIEALLRVPEPILLGVLAMNRMAWVLLGSVAVVGALLLLMNDAASDKSLLDKPGNKTEPLLLFCAASNRGVMESIRTEYEREFNRSIQIQYV